MDDDASYCCTTRRRGADGSLFSLYFMHGCTQQVSRRDVPHANHDELRMDRFSNSRVSSTIFTSPTAAVAQTPRFNATNRRRLYGLNSRFDRMLQEITWGSHDSSPFLRRRKRAYSSDSSSVTNRDLPKTPIEIEYESPKLGKSFIPAMPESWLPEATLWGKAYLSPPQAVVGSPPKLPEWLNNTLATLPPDNAVRCLTLPPDHPIRKDHTNRRPHASEDGSVFAFQAPVDGCHPAGHTKTKGQPRADPATFRTADREPVELHGCCSTASDACAAPFSTPGPGWTTSQTSASCRQRRPTSASCISPPTGTGTLEVLDSTTLPFSTPGPFVPARPTYGHVLDRGPITRRDLASDAVLPVAGWSGATAFPDPRVPKIDRLDSYLPPDQGNGDEFFELFSSAPKFILDDVAGLLSTPEPVPPTGYFGTPIENLSFSPTTKTAPSCSKDRLTVATSPRSLTWGSPTTVTRPSGVADNTSHRTRAVFLSDIQLDENGAFPLTQFPIESSLDSGTESLPNPHRSQVAPTGMSPPVTPPPPPLSKHLPADFGWISPDTRTPDSFERIGSVDWANID